MRPLLALLALAALGALLAAAPAPAAPAGCGPAFGVALDGYPIGRERLDLLKAQTGLAPRLVVFFLQWPAPGQPGRAPLETLAAIEAAGALPVITWEPMHLVGPGRERAVPAEDILTGRYDQYLKSFAAELKQWGKPLVIRFAHEMNLKRYHWGGRVEEYGPASPALYRRMFRHVVRTVRGQGADKVLWAFCPNAESQPHPRWDRAAWNTAGAYWPGHDVVDILGMDGYNWGASRNQAQHGWQSRWLSFGRIFGELREELARLAPEKPLVVFETSCALAGGDRVAWLQSALDLAGKWGLKGLAWFQANKEVDWRLTPERDQKALVILRRATACPGRGPFLSPR